MRETGRGWIAEFPMEETFCRIFLRSGRRFWITFRNLAKYGAIIPEDLRNENCYSVPQMISHIREWFYPEETVRQEITVEGGHLALKMGYRVKSSVSLILLPVYVPECRSYTVEYRLSETGEFEASLDDRGSITIRCGLDLRHRFPVCWLPRSFAGKRIDRYILMVDRKRVSYRAGIGHPRAA